MTEIRKLKVELPANERIETGPVQVNEDWPCFFIRGDDAFALRMALAGYIINHNDVLAGMQLRAWVQMLDGCNVNQKLVKELNSEPISGKEGTLHGSDRSS